LNGISEGRTVVTDVGSLEALAMAAALCMGAGLELIRRGWFGAALGGSVLQRTGRLLFRAFWILCVAAYIVIFGAVGWRVVRHLANG
jgi:hypothetical protein